MVACSPSLTGGLHANKKIEIPSAQSRDIGSPNLGVVNWSQTYSMTLNLGWSLSAHEHPGYPDSPVEQKISVFVCVFDKACKNAAYREILTIRVHVRWVHRVIRAWLSCFRNGNNKTDSEGPPRGLRRCFGLVGSRSELVLLFLGVHFKKRQNDFQKNRLLLSPQFEQSNGPLWLTMQQN
jgi:hypothetical protein